MVLNLKKVPWKGLIILLLCAAIVYGGTLLYEEVTRPDPREAVLQGIGKSLQAQNYRYQAIAKRRLDGQETILSEIWGEKNSQGVHLKGNLPIIGAEVEIYQVADKMYRRDPLTQGWLVVSQQGKASLEQLIAELNPLSVFNPESDFEVRYVGTERVGRIPCRVYEVMTKGENKYVELYWQDFNFRFWLAKKDGYLHKAEIFAEHREDSQHILTVDLTFFDYDEHIEIQPPAA